MKQVVFEQYLDGNQVELLRIDIIKEDITEDEIADQLDGFSDLLRLSTGRVSLSNGKDFVVVNPNLGPVQIFVDEV